MPPMMNERTHDLTEKAGFFVLESQRFLKNVIAAMVVARVMPK